MKEEQLFCAKCGKANWSEYFKTCECKEPDFKFKTYAEYLSYKEDSEVNKDEPRQGNRDAKEISGV